MLKNLLCRRKKGKIRSAKRRSSTKDSAFNNQARRGKTLIRLPEEEVVCASVRMVENLEKKAPEEYLP